ncbi:hypothetical protein ACWC5I_00820 [Kitasatospora sp. NPDC001574]
MSQPNDPANNAYYETKVTEIRAAISNGDIDGAARITVEAATESEHTGPTTDSGTWASLSAAAKRLSNP